MNLNLSLVKEVPDVTKLPYLYPKMPLLRYKKMAHEYYKKVALKAAEEVAKANDCFLLPACCMNYKRRDPKKRVSIYGKNYYAVSYDEITPLEYEKYKLLCEDVESWAV